MRWKAFAVSAVGYLLKPVRRRWILARLRWPRPQKLESHCSCATWAVGIGQGEVDAGRASHSVLGPARVVELIPIDYVLYFIADHKYVTLRHY